ncbi:MAG TPA: hypothetical protein PLB89_06100 [Flavobacteriales bacterium]|nr:hypothetical protein [Flavobacteriales bacterium]
MNIRCLSLLFSLSMASAHAADRIVEEFGVSPTYPNVTSAVNAAVDGDRIVIKNRGGNIPWIENITVDKSLQFVSFTENDFFYVQGDYRLVAAPGRTIDIIGMRNTFGGITSDGTADVRSTRVRILDCFFVEGTVVIDNPAFDVQLVGCTLNGDVRLQFGNVIGNRINADWTGLALETNATSPVTDTCVVMGNIVLGHNGFVITSTQQVLHIRNNFITHAGYGIEVHGGSLAATNILANNTVFAGGCPNIVLGMSVISPGAPTPVWEYMNNVITQVPCEPYSIGMGGPGNAYYNHVNANDPINVTDFMANNTTDVTIELDSDGRLTNAVAAIDGANPSPVFYDLDLSPGDAGAYGGSYSLDNFHPLHTGAARTYLTHHAYNIRSGNTLRVRAQTFDR